MNIKLDKSLAIFDLEATGLSVTQDRIVEIAIVKIAPDGTETNYSKRVNPEMHIPKEVSEIHGIYDEDVADAPTFRDILPELVPACTGSLLKKPLFFFSTHCDP